MTSPLDFNKKADVGLVVAMLLIGMNRKNFFLVKNIFETEVLNR